MSSENRGYNLPDRGETEWDVLLNENFEEIDRDIHELFNLKSGDAVDGIVDTHDHVGPMRQGAMHDTSDYGIMFWAQEGLSINSAVIDTDLSSVSTSEFPVGLYEHDGDESTAATEIARTTVTVSGGPERIDLSGLPDLPADGEYILARPESDNGETIPARRIPGSDWGPSNYDEHTYDRIDFRQGIKTTSETGGTDFYYYFFDISIGSSYEQVTSPWSHDVDEIYMRPTDPKEEFDDVSPRALWIDTS